MTRHLSNDDFFTQLSSLFESNTHGSVYLTQKRMPSSNKDEPKESTEPAQPFPDLEPSEPASILIRATNGEGKEGRKGGKKIKLSTIVEVDQLDGFFVRYAEICKTRMSGLKKRDRSKAKEKLKAKKKKQAGATT